MARPTKLTPQVQERILEAVRAGNFREVAAHYAGVGAQTLSRWMGRQREPYASFRQALLDAEAHAEIRAVALILKAAAEDPKHAEWWLERKFPERWGRRERLDVRVDVEHRIRLMARDLGLDEDEAVAEALRILERGNASAR